MKHLVVANWKCNPTTLKEAKRLFNSVKNGLKNIKKVEVVICPPFIYLLNLKSEILNLRIGAQDCFWEESGAFTGEVSPSMLKNLGCQYVILGHSERRRILGETNEMISKKIKAAIDARLKPILCIGETEKEKQSGRTFKVLKKQLQTVPKNTKSLVIAYEPIWAIGTGKACGVSEAKSANVFIKKLVKNFPVLYGGSVNSQNARGFIKEAKFQGLLVGGASLDAKEFIRILKAAS